MNHLHFGQSSKSKTFFWTHEVTWKTKIKVMAFFLIYPKASFRSDRNTLVHQLLAVNACVYSWHGSVESLNTLKVNWQDFKHKCNAHTVNHMMSELPDDQPEASHRGNRGSYDHRRKKDALESLFLFQQMHKTLVCIVLLYFFNLDRRRARKPK